MQYLCEVLISKNVPNVRFVILGILRMIRPNYYDLKSVRIRILQLFLAETLRKFGPTLLKEPAVGSIIDSIS